MARLKLNPNFTLKDLGREVLVAARGRHLGEQAIKENAEAKIVTMFSGDDKVTLNNPNIEFRYDTPDTVYVVIPDIGDKIVRDEEDFFPDFDFDHLAAETMGFIVIFGCGK